MSSLVTLVTKSIINFTLPFVRSFLLLCPLLALGAVVVYAYEQTNSRRLQLEPVEAEVVEELVEEEYPPEEFQDDGTNDLIHQQEHPDTTPPHDFFNAAEHAPPEFDVGGAGPAAPQQARPHIPRTRNVGTKKARSLARRDQRRAYHEFLHSQAAMRASAAAAVAEEEEERMFEEKRRRALIEDEIAAKKEVERKAKFEAERKAVEKERGDVEELKRKVSVPGAWRVKELGGRRGEEWGSEVLRREGLVGRVKGGGGEDVGIITGEGWYVRLGERQLGMISGEIERRGRMEWGEIAEKLEWVVGK